MSKIANLSVVTGLILMIAGFIFSFIDHESCVEILLMGIFNLLFGIAYQTSKE